MENIASFFGGIIALAALCLLLAFELSMENMLFVYAIYALIIIVAGALAISIRGTIAAAIKALAGRAGRIPRHREVLRGEGITEKKIERFLKTSKPPAREPKRAVQVRNPMLRKIAENLGPGKPRKKSGFQGLAKRLRGIGMPGPKLPKTGIKKPGKPNKKPPKGKPGPAIEEGLKGAEKSILKMINKGMQKAAGRPRPKKPVKEKPRERPKPKEKRPEKPRGKPGKIPAAKPKHMTKEPETSGSCQICGSGKGLKMHYIVPPERGGAREEENTILLCGTHREQAEEGMYSENLLRKLKNS